MREEKSINRKGHKGKYAKYAEEEEEKRRVGEREIYCNSGDCFASLTMAPYNIEFRKLL